MKQRTRNDSALYEDLQAVLVDLLIEHGLHRRYQTAMLATVPEDLRTVALALVREEQEVDAYIEGRLRDALAILAEGRPGPAAYNPDRPAIRAAIRPMGVTA